MDMAWRTSIYIIAKDHNPLVQLTRKYLLIFLKDIAKSIGNQVLDPSRFGFCKKVQLFKLSRYYDAYNNYQN